MQRYGLFFLEQLSLRRENCFTFLVSPYQVLLFYRSSYSLHPLIVSYTVSLQVTPSNRITGSLGKLPESVTWIGQKGCKGFKPDLTPKDITWHWQVFDFTVNKSFQRQIFTKRYNKWLHFRDQHICFSKRKDKTNCPLIIRTGTRETDSRDLKDSKYVGFQTSQMEVKSWKLSGNSKWFKEGEKTLMFKMPSKCLNHFTKSQGSRATFKNYFIWCNFKAHLYNLI